MLLDEITELEVAKIKVNSFYDVYQRNYTEEELQMYNELTGMPLVDSYEQLLDSLKD